MDPSTGPHLALWKEGRTRFTNQLPTLTAADLPKKRAPRPNSAGFLLSGIGDVELLFAKNVFGLQAVQVHSSTVAKGHDTGEWTDLTALTAYVQESAGVLGRAIIAQTDADCDVVIETKEFGKKTKAEALDRIVTHTACNAGQLAMVMKYGGCPVPTHATQDNCPICASANHSTSVFLTSSKPPPRHRISRACAMAIIPFRITDPPKDAPLFSPSAG